jgi:hypothetical protein
MSAAAGAAGASRFCNRGHRARHGLDQEVLDFVEQGLGLEGLGNPAIGTDHAGTRLIKGLEGPRQQQNRDIPQLRLLLDRGAQFIAVFPGHDNVGKNQIGPPQTRFLEGGITVAHGCQVDVLTGTNDPDNLLDGHTVIGQQQLFIHSSLLRPMIKKTARFETVPGILHPAATTAAALEEHFCRPTRGGPTWFAADQTGTAGAV